MGQLQIPDQPRTLVYKKLVTLLKADPVLKRLIAPASWHTYTEGRADDDAAFGEGEMPAIRILPFAAGAGPESPALQNSPLGIRIDIATDGLDVGDLLNLWGCIENVVFTGDGTKTVLQLLQSAYSRVVSVRLTQPAITPSPPDLANKCMAASGTLTVEMLVKK